MLIARDFLGDDDFVMYLGDNFIVGGISALVDEFERPGRPTRRSCSPACRTRASSASPSSTRPGQVGRAGREASRRPKSDLALVGVYLFTPAVHEAVRKIQPSARGELEITDAIQWLIDNGPKVRSTSITGYWKDTGNVADMLEVNRTVLERARGREQQGTVDASDRDHRPGRIETGRPGYAGPASSARSSSARDCVVDGLVHRAVHVGRPRSAASTAARSSTRSCCAARPISGVRRIEASLIGRNVEVTPAPAVPAAHRLVLGDHSKVQICS